MVRPMSWKVFFYSDKVWRSIHLWPSGMRAKFLWIIDEIICHGPRDVGMPHIKGLGKGLFEIRVKSNEGIARALFCMRNQKIIVVLSEFIKKTQKTPPDELKLALKRMDEVIKNEKISIS